MRRMSGREESRIFNFIARMTFEKFVNITVSSVSFLRSLSDVNWGC